MADNVIIKIDGDDSGFRKALEGIGKTTKAGMADVKAGIDLATAAVQKLSSVAKKGLDYNATIEQMQTSFEVMTGSAEKAAEVVERLRLMGAETPFETTDLVNTTQLLMQYGFTADDAIDKMRMLGDIAQGNTEAMNSIAMGYAQMSSAGKVNLQDIKQMINGGFNPLQEISERTGESMASLYDRISKGTLTIDEITQSMVNATSEGGKFFQSMEKQSQTLNGQLSTLKDNTDQLLGSLTEGFSAEMRDELLPLANNMIGELQEAFSAHGTQGLVDAATDMIPRLLDMMTGEFEKGVEAVGKWLPKGAQALMKSVPGALRSAGKIAPEITTIFFELASTIITDLVAMLPELAPVIMQGFADTLLAALNGVGRLVEGFFTGAEQMFHQGQKKIAGVWVDQEALAKYTFKIDTDVSPAEKSIEGAYSDIREALDSDLLTDTQRAEIISMIGEDYDAIKAKLMSFGLDDTQASEIAGQITSASETITAKFKELDIGVDATTVAKWAIQANGSRIMLRSQLEKAGLSPEDQQAVIGVFDTMTSNITGSLPNVVDEIYATLTDGKAENDDKKSLKDKLDEAYAADLAEVDEWLSEQVGELDTESSTYAEDVAALTEEAAGYKAEITTLYNEMAVLTETLAGKPTAAVQEQMQAFVDIETRLNEIQQKINETNEAARTAEENAFEAVRAGVNADEATITQAVKFKVTEFKLDEQAAEDEYNSALDALNEQLAKGERGEKGGITAEEYNTKKGKLEADKNAAIAQAKATFEKSFADIMQGIAESEGNAEAFKKVMEQQGAKLAVDDFFSNMFTDTGKIDQSKLSGVTDRLGALLGEEFNIESIMRDAQFAENTGDASALIENIANQLSNATWDLDDNKKAALGGKVGEMWQSVLDQNYLEGTSFDVTGTENQLSALFGAVNLEPAGEDMTAGVGQGMASYDFSTDAARAEQNAERAIRSAAQSHSPAQAFVPIGSDFSAGVAQGMSEFDFGSAASSLAGSAQRAGSAAFSGKGESIGKNFGTGVANGIYAKRASIVAAAKSVAQSAVRAMEATLDIHSPSKVAEGIGKNFGEGFAGGIQTSMARAVLVAKQMSGQIVTAADISQSMRVANMPNLQQEIISANEQNKTPVYLDGYKIAEIQGYNNSTTLAWNNTRAAKGVGGR